MMESAMMVEFDRTENVLRDKLIKPSFTLVDGMIIVPDAPGLGVDVDLELLEKYLKN